MTPITKRIPSLGGTGMSKSIVPPSLPTALGPPEAEVTHGRITCFPPMEISAQDPRLGQRSQVHAHGKRLPHQRAAWRFHAQPFGTVICAIECPPDNRRSRNEQD